MAVTRASKLISLTDNATGVLFAVSLRKIIKVVPSGGNSIVTYIDQDGSKKSRLCTEASSAIATASLSNDVAVLQQITLLDSSTMYVNNDRVVYVDTISGGSRLRLDAGNRKNLIYDFSLPTAANFKLATDNIISVTTLDGTVRYINNYYIDQANSITGGCEVLYDTNRSAEFHKLNINITLSALRTLVNAL
jgi:hypothetical protein